MRQISPSNSNDKIDSELTQSNRSSHVVMDFGDLVDQENKREEHDERLNIHIQFIKGMISEDGSKMSTASFSESKIEPYKNESKIEYLEEK